MSPRRASPPPPLPPLRVCPDTPRRFRSGRARADCSLPPPAPGGGINTISEPSKPSTPAPTSSQSPPLPPLAPARSRPIAFARGVPRQTARCPLPLPEGAFNYIIHTFQHNYCVSAPPSLGRFFFLCSVVHLGPCLASLRPGPRRSPSQRFFGCAHHKGNS